MWLMVAMNIFYAFKGAMKIVTIMEHFTPPPAVIVDNSLSMLLQEIYTMGE